MKAALSTTASDDSEGIEIAYYLDIILKRRWIVAVATLAVVLFTALFTFTMRPVYEAHTMLEIEKERGGGIAQSQAMIENSDADYYETQYKLLHSESLLRKVFGELDLSHAADFQGPRGFEKFQKAVAITPILHSRLVYVRIESHSPQLAARISNQISSDFVEQNLGNQLFISKEVLRALQMKDGRASYDSLPAVVNSPLIQNLKSEYVKLRSQYADMSARYTPRHPAMIALRSNIAAVQGQIAVETDRIVQSLKTELSGQLKGNNVRVIDPADIPVKPVRPRKVLNMSLSLIAGLLLGILLAVAIESIDQSVRTQDDIESKLGQPFLGVIPQTALKDGRVVEALLSKELSLTSEAFRNLRTMVDFAGIDGKAKTLLVTSSVQGEGKTFVAANLAVALAQLGESVLLIDGDLRRPQIHRTFAISSERGLATFLSTGKDAREAESLVQPSEIPGLKLLPCGPRPPNPSELLNTPRLQALVVWARSNFDRVIIDCTPMFPINDTLLWGRHVNSAVFICRYGKTRIPLIIDACKKLTTGGIHILGVAVNSATTGGLSYSSGYYYYYRQYYHHYGPETEVVSS